MSITLRKLKSLDRLTAIQAADILHVYRPGDKDYWMHAGDLLYGLGYPTWNSTDAANGDYDIGTRVTYGFRLWESLTNDNVAIPTEGANWTEVSGADTPVEHYRGLYTSLANLQSALPTANPGDFADVDPGSGTDLIRYAWDEDEGWVPVGSGTIGGSTGGTDNAILRADGAGGVTVQSSGATIDDSGNITANAYISANGFIYGNSSTPGDHTFFFVPGGTGTNINLTFDTAGTGIFSWLNDDWDGGLTFYEDANGHELVPIKAATGRPFRIRGAVGVAGSVAGEDVHILGGSPSTNGNGGYVYINPSAGNGVGLAGNLGFFATTLADWQDGEKIAFWANMTTAPTAAPIGGAFMWVEGGQMKIWESGAGSSFTVGSGGGGWAVTGSTTITGNVTIANSTYTVSFSGSGAVGVGLTPTAKFHVQGNGTSSGNLVTFQNSSAQSKFEILDNGATSFVPTISGNFGSYTNLKISGTFNCSGGTNNFWGYRVQPTINTSGGTNVIYGFDFNPSITSQTGTRLVALRASAGSILVGGSSLSANTGTAGLVLVNPSTNPTGAQTDGIVIHSKDSSDGSANATLALYLEQAVEAIGTFTPSHKLKIWINGTEYWIQLDAV